MTFFGATFVVFSSTTIDKEGEDDVVVPIFVVFSILCV